MTTVPRLAVFDVDGTLIDSQAHIVSAANLAFNAAGYPPPDRNEILGIVGLSLPEAIARLAPDATSLVQAEIVRQYKRTFNLQGQSSIAPLYPGARETLEQLYGQRGTVLGVATGNSRRGMARVITHHRMQRLFATIQVADDHPSKPHPSMLLAALDETGADHAAAVMIGDTSYDMQMGIAAGMYTIGVTWGYHGADALRVAGARQIVTSYDALGVALKELWVDG